MNEQERILFVCRAIIIRVQGVFYYGMHEKWRDDVWNGD